LSGRPMTPTLCGCRQALDAGAVMVNDVTALRGDPELGGVVADAGAFLCLMHMQGTPRNMQEAPRYDDVVSDVVAFLENRPIAAVPAGVPGARICPDPGTGFGETAGTSTPPPALRSASHVLMRLAYFFCAFSNCLSHSAWYSACSAASGVLMKVPDRRLGAEIRM